MFTTPETPPVSRARIVWAAVRLGTAAALLVAIIAQLVATASYAQSQGHDLATAIANHLSYFTVLSTAAGAIVLTIGGVWLAKHVRQGIEPRWLSLLFLCIGSAVVITGIVYNVLLRNDGAPDPDTLMWASEIKHVVAPLVFAIDLVIHLARPAMRWSDISFALIYPIAWAAYTLVRGEFIADPVTGNPWWYPYGFLDPHKSADGYASVAMYIVGIAALLAAIAALSVWASRRTRKAEAKEAQK